VSADARIDFDRATLPWLDLPAADVDDSIPAPERPPELEVAICDLKAGPNREGREHLNVSTAA
jgi:hypothetical protein